MKKNTSNVSRFNINKILTDTLVAKLNDFSSDKLKTESYTKKLGLISEIIG